ncbi:MAG TPA: zinc-dependent metalloprotease [Kofleriaceae bacterium]|nr:zinc-dependent metalloprotease [Kofleriaceae bacterium]
MRQSHAPLWTGTIAALAIAGCATADAPDVSLSSGDALVAIPRDVAPQAIAGRDAALQARNLANSADRNDDFYLAIRRSMLDQKWFLSVYLRELSPFGPNPATLGTRVVRFREQNGKLFVFNADDRLATSDVFSPDLIIDAFPIVQSSHFNALPGSGGYVLIDPSAGNNRFSALADLFATGSAPVRLETELSFVQAFHRFDDGASYEQIVTTYAQDPIAAPGGVDPDEFRLAATLGVSLRRYFESPEFAPVATPDRPHFFLSDPVNVPDTGAIAQTPVHWAFAPGKPAVKWLISPELAKISADPAFGGADLVAAARRGIESWNDVFGYPVFSAELDTHDTSFAEDRVNYLIVDPDTSKGFAFADWRTNPVTGETRGASIYFGGGFFAPLPDDAPASAAALPTPKPTGAVRTLQWQGANPEPLCVMWGVAYQPHIGVPGNAALTGKQKLEAYIQHVVTHEVGHTLGLRHNFEGSLVPPTSSIMEYSVLEAAIAAPTPGPYDRAAIAYLYGKSTALPTQPFATDEDTLVDPDAVRFDAPSPTPLTDYQIPQYASFTSALIAGQLPPALAPLIVQLFGTETLGFVRQGTPADAATAWKAMLDGARSPLASPAAAAAADALSAAVFDELYLHTTGAITAPPGDPAVLAAIAADGKALLINSDGARSFATRRLVVDALKKAQTQSAFLALRDARDAINATLNGLDPSSRALTEDLLARITAAISPYFE